MTFGYVFGTEGIDRGMLAIQFSMYSYQYIFMLWKFCRLTRSFEAYRNVIQVSFNSMPAILRAERSLPFDGIPVYQYLLKNSGNGDMLPSNRPWDTVQYYYEQLCQLSKEFLCKLGMSMFEHLLELEERHEFQQHGSIYSHCIMD